ncbi:NAD(P)-dependent oxidoreductase [Oceanobacillus arenosus]|nr:NAD(P)-dependent oxidoreductase [Oceanobacillus arenosus]
MKKVVILNAMLHSAGEEFLAERNIQIEKVPMDSPIPNANVIEKVKDADGLIVRLPAGVNRELIEAAPQLKVIATSGTGSDHIDINASNEHNIPVVNNAGVGALPVAEHAVGLMLALGKRIVTSEQQLRKKGWVSREQFLNEKIGTELSGKTIGIIGFGFIGQTLAKILKNGFGVELLVYDPVISNEMIESAGATQCDSVKELSEKSDYVSIHVPHNKHTHHLINREILDSMKPSAFLINCARGGVIDQDELVKAIKEKRIAGAGIDVFPEEPPQLSDEIFSLNEVIVTPHIAGITEETNRKLSLSAAKQVLQVLEGEKPESLVNVAVWENRRVAIER